MSNKDKEKKPNPLESLDARIQALEKHNGWTPGECPPADYIGANDTTDTTGDGDKTGDGDDDKKENE